MRPIDADTLIAALHERLQHPKKPGQSAGIAAAERLVQRMPTVEQPRAEWLEVDLSGHSDHNDIHCGRCFRPVTEKTNYCPHCGVGMRGDEDD